MKNKESKKISKIVDELMLYFLKAGHLKFSLDFEIVNKIINIEFKFANFDEKLLPEIAETINLKRELEVEEYGWELMGESDCSNELELIGLLIDNFSYSIENGVYLLKFTRKIV